MDVALRDLVRNRAGNRCEYCLIRQDQDVFFTFPVDHIIALQHGGKTEADNLCPSCYRCNSHKGPNIASIDPETGELVRLFHPDETIGPSTSTGKVRSWWVARQSVVPRSCFSRSIIPTTFFCVNR